jgi:hypothetical protein
MFAVQSNIFRSFVFVLGSTTVTKLDFFGNSPLINRICDATNTSIVASQIHGRGLLITNGIGHLTGETRKVDFTLAMRIEVLLLGLMER